MPIIRSYTHTQTFQIHNGQKSLLFLLLRNHCNRATDIVHQTIIRHVPHKATQQIHVSPQIIPRLVIVFSRVIYVPPTAGSLILAVNAIIATYIEYNATCNNKHHNRLLTLTISGQIDQKVCSWQIIPHAQYIFLGKSYWSVLVPYKKKLSMAIQRAVFC